MKIFIFLLLSLHIYAQDVKVRVEPENPIVGENFEVIFDITSQNDINPIISFNPYNVEVLSKENKGVSTRSTYINGKVTTERTVSVAYELVSTKSGTAQLRDIIVELDTQKLKFRTYSFKVGNTARRAKDLIAVAIADKENAYIGESIIVRYYTYHRVRASTAQIEKFPELKDFLKRFHQEKQNDERVIFEGQEYVRSLIYTAQLFPNKAGKLKVDSISIKVSYNEGGNSFGGFGGFGGFGRTRTKTLRSEPLEINVLPVPTQGMPKDFSGLVGKHSFKLEASRSKYVANEPIEFKLQVSGKGALELFEAPILILDTKVEEFEKNATLELQSDFSARKAFQYTYLGRQNGTIASRDIKFSYFDPKTKQFVQESVTIPSIIIAGAQAITPLQNTSSHSDNKKHNQSTPEPRVDLTPLYKLDNTIIYKTKDILILLIFLISIFFIYTLYKYIKKAKRLVKNDFYLDLKKNGIDYGKLFKLAGQFNNNGSLRGKISASSLSTGSKKQLLEIAQKCEKDFEKGIQKTYKLSRSLINEIFSMLNNNEKI